ncbi:MAG: UvrD-helicase domain-containing protein, partial [Spirochaetales bacterium]|nr:UvrD-helicase domain-containing protein [Spirochaetales bacterium]
MAVNLFDPAKADLRQSINLEASAGTGKTYNLERVVCELVERYGLGIDEILVVTFTNKAASELKERIRLLLDERASGGKVALQKARQNFDKAPIYTIHAFCQTVLKSYPFESGSPFSQELLSDNSLLEEGIEEVLYREFMDIPDEKRDLIRSCFSSGIDECITTLVKEVKAALEDSGSIRLPSDGMIERVLKEKDLYTRGEGEIRKAADTLLGFAPDEERLHQILVELPSRSLKTTSKNAAKVWSFLPPAGSLGEWLTAFLDNQCLKKLGYLSEEKRKDKLPEAPEDIELCRAVDDLFDALEPLLDPDDVNRTIYHKTLGFTYLQELLESSVSVIQKKKSLRGALDFSDLIGTLADLLKKDPEGPLSQVLRNQYKVVLVDEFQDTDSRQWSIFKTLFDCPEHNYFLIGDPKQSIYGFRGADLEVYFDACSTVDDQNSYSLSTNYRSRSELVEACNTIFGRVFSYELDGFTRVPFDPVESGNEKAPAVVDRQGRQMGAVQFCPVPVDAEENKTASKSKLQEAWMDWAVREIGCLLKGSCSFELEGESRTIRPGDIAVLAESNGVCLEIQKQLSARGISSVIFSDRKIIETPEAEVFGSLLGALAWPESKSASLALLMTSAFDLSSEEVQILQESDSFQEYLLYLQKSREICNQGDLVGFFRAFFEQEIPLSFMEGKGSWRNRLLKRTEGIRSTANLTHLAEIFHGEQKQRSLDMGELYDHYLQMKNNPEADDEKQVRLDQDGQAVQILTHHRSKGLEFPIVFFFGADKSGVSSRDGEALDYYWDGERYRDYLKTKVSKKKADLSAWEERKRLYYVSLTRASSLLYMPWFPEGDLTYLTTIYAALGGDDLILEEDELFEAETLQDLWPVHSLRSTDFKKAKKPTDTAGAKTRIFNDRISEVLSSLASERPGIFAYRTDSPDPDALDAVAEET